MGHCKIELYLERLRELGRWELLRCYWCCWYQQSLPVEAVPGLLACKGKQYLPIKNLCGPSKAAAGFRAPSGPHLGALVPAGGPAGGSCNPRVGQLVIQRP